LANNETLDAAETLDAKEKLEIIDVLTLSISS